MIKKGIIFSLLKIGETGMIGLLIWGLYLLGKYTKFLEYAMTSIVIIGSLIMLGSAAVLIYKAVVWWIRVNIVFTYRIETWWEAKK